MTASMLCACSGEQFRIDEVPQSPESLATRDFSVSGISSRTGEWESRFDDSQVDDVESTLKESLSLNYEEARALLGRLEYQRGNLDAALQVFQGINISGLKPRMIRAIVERTRQRRRVRSKRGAMLPSVMSMHSVSLLLEAILLKSKSLDGLGQEKEAAMECKYILDIVEAACPHGMVDSFENDCKLQEIFHQSLTLLPNLWKKAGFLDEAVYAYRRALTRPWNLPSSKLTSFQKDLAALLLYGGVDADLPLTLQHVCTGSPMNNVEEAVLLLFVLMRKVALQEIDWDPEIMDHLSFALSVCGQFDMLANHVEQLLPGIYRRRERWYLLALIYSAAGQDDAALNLLRKSVGYSERRLKPHLPSLLLGAKLCSQSKKHASEGVGFSQRALKYSDHQGKHFAGLAYRLLGVCSSLYAKSCVFDSERVSLNRQALNSLQFASKVQKDDTESIFSLGKETAMQGNLSEAFVNAAKYLDMVGGSSVRGWKLLVHVVSAEQNFRDAEAIVNLAIDEVGIHDQLGFLRLKAILHTLQEQPIHAIETYRILLAMVQAQRENFTKNLGKKETLEKNVELDAWLDLASIYNRLESWPDSEICVDKAKSISYFSPRCWHMKGKLLEAQAQHHEAMLAFAAALSMDSDYVPSMVSAATMLCKLGRKALPIARSFLMNALRLEPMNHEAWLNLGQVSKMEGFLVQAADYFQAAYELKQTAPALDIV